MKEKTKTRLSLLKEEHSKTRGMLLIVYSVLFDRIFTGTLWCKNIIWTLTFDLKGHCTFEVCIHTNMINDNIVKYTRTGKCTIGHHDLHQRSAMTLTLTFDPEVIRILDWEGMVTRIPSVQLIARHQINYFHDLLAFKVKFKVMVHFVKRQEFDLTPVKIWQSYMQK